MAKKKKKGMPAGILVLLCVVVLASGYLGTRYFYAKEKYAGQAQGYSRQAVREVDENSFEGKLAKHFYTNEQWAAIRSNSLPVVQEENTISNTVPADDTDGVEIVPVYGSTYEGYMMLVKNPEDISVAVNPNLGSGSDAPSLDDYVSMYNALAGINGGGFEDAGGNGNGSIPQGIVIHKGQIVYGNPNSYVDLIGITGDQKLICAGATGAQALEWGVQEGVTFGPVFISNYENVFVPGTDNLGMLNPRTAIGQTSDGTFLLLVIDGRGPTSFGALYEDVVQIFQSYGAAMAANLDGGNSSAMMYKGEYVNTPVSMYGSRSLPTTFLVKGDN